MSSRAPITLDHAPATQAPHALALDLQAVARALSGEGYLYDDYLEQARRAWRALDDQALAFGLAMAAIRRHSPHGEYRKALHDLGVARTTSERFADRATWLAVRLIGNTDVQFHGSTRLTHSSADDSSKWPNLDHLPAEALTDLSGDQLDYLKSLSEEEESKVLDLQAGTLCGRPLAEVATWTSKMTESRIMQVIGRRPMRGKSRSKKAAPTEAAWEVTFRAFRDLDVADKNRFLSLMGQVGYDQGTDWQVVRRT